MIASTTPAIRASGLTKVFGAQRAVDGLNLEVPSGSVYGFLGPNGSGKTTTIRMLLGLVSPSSGSAQLLGETMPRAAQRVLPRVGALVEGPAFYPFLSGYDNLVRLDAADTRSVPATRRARVNHALERVGLSHAASKKAGNYSLGMKQRLGLANALLRPRELLILDEPSNGLDPQGTREVRALIRSLTAEGVTVFVSSHLLSEIEQLCTHAAIMRAGRLVASGTLDELRTHSERRISVTTPDIDTARAVLTSHTGGGSVTIDSPSTISCTLTEEILVETVTAALVAAGVRVRGIVATGESLEDLFVGLTGEGFDVAG